MSNPDCATRTRLYCPWTAHECHAPGVCGRGSVEDCLAEKLHEQIPLWFCNSSPVVMFQHVGLPRRVRDRANRVHRYPVIDPRAAVLDHEYGLDIEDGVLRKGDG